jgi:hypothetical protein
MGWTVIIYTVLIIHLILLTFCISVPKLIVDREGRTSAILAGRPKGKIMEDGMDDFSNLTERAAARLGDAGKHAKITQKWQKNNRRGKFDAIATGISFGHGQTVNYFHPPLCLTY